MGLLAVVPLAMVGVGALLLISPRGYLRLARWLRWQRGLWQATSGLSEAAQLRVLRVVGAVFLAIGGPVLCVFVALALAYLL